MASVTFQNSFTEASRFDRENGDMLSTPDPDTAEWDYLASDGNGDRAFSRMETPADTAFARTKREEESVLRSIQQARAIASPTVDLSGKHLMAIPDELMQMEDVEVRPLSLSLSLSRHFCSVLLFFS